MLLNCELRNHLLLGGRYSERWREFIVRFDFLPWTDENLLRRRHTRKEGQKEEDSFVHAALGTVTEQMGCRVGKWAADGGHCIVPDLRPMRNGKIPGSRPTILPSFWEVRRIRGYEYGFFFFRQPQMKMASFNVKHKLIKRNIQSI